MSANPSAGTTAPLTTGQVATRCGCRHETVVQWISRGVRVQGRRVKLTAFRAGRRYKVTEAGLEAFLAACAGQSEPVQRVTHARASKEALAAQERARRVLNGEKE